MGQGAAVGFLVADLGQATGRVVAVVAAGAVGAFDLAQAPGGVVAELGAALAAGQALQAAACVPAGLEGVFALAGKACDELRALAGCVPGGSALAVRAGFAGFAAQRVLAFDELPGGVVLVPGDAASRIGDLRDAAQRVVGRVCAQARVA